MTNKLLTKTNKKIGLEEILYLFIIICPLLDAASFIFRNYFNTTISISTILRPIIPIVAIIYIFFKDKIKIPLIIGGITYAIYAFIHIYIFEFLKTECSYGNIIRELQYLVNYTFMIMNLFIYIYVFIFRKSETDKNKKIEKINKALLIAFTIYLLLMYVSIFTGTSSPTYTEDKMGYKGWFESGNSVGAIMVMLLFTLLPKINEKIDKKIKIWIIIDTILAGIYLSTLLGTRVGLFGFILTIGIYIICQILYTLYHKEKINKKILGIGIVVFASLTIIILVFGSITLNRRKLLKERNTEIFDEYINESAHVTGDILDYVKQIKNQEISDKYMSKEMQTALIDLYEFNNKHKISSTNMRAIQMVYHCFLIKEQNSIALILFGNGYMTHYREMIFEMEVPAFLFNFGIYGFILYFIPFFIIAIIGIYYCLKNLKKIKVETIMSVLGVCFAIAISFFSGYTFFNQSAATIITVMCVITIYEIIKMKGEKVEKDSIWNNESDFGWSRESTSRPSKQTSGKA